MLGFDRAGWSIGMTVTSNPSNQPAPLIREWLEQFPPRARADLEPFAVRYAGSGTDEIMRSRLDELGKWYWKHRRLWTGIQG